MTTTYLVFRLSGMMLDKFGGNYIKMLLINNDRAVGYLELGTWFSESFNVTTWNSC